jgi:hypothetical protein
MVRGRHVDGEEGYEFRMSQMGGMMHASWERVKP